MRLRIVLSLALALGALNGTGCLGRSPAVHYYSLGFESQPPAQTPAPDASVLIGPARLPAYLERPELARRTSTGEIELDASHRWLGSFEESFLRALSLGVGRRLDSTRVVAHPSKAPFPIDYQVRLHVDDLIVDADGSLRARIRWALIGPAASAVDSTPAAPPSAVAPSAGAPAAVRDAEEGAAPAALFSFEARREDVGARPAARVEAHEALLGELATQIAAAIAEARGRASASDAQQRGTRQAEGPALPGICRRESDRATVRCIAAESQRP